MGRPEPRFVPSVPTAFGEDAFGRRAEAAARFFGTPKYIAGQTAVVIAWIAVNTALTREDKILTEKIEVLTREIHARLPSG
jgi:hypothetical protein